MSFLHVASDGSIGGAGVIRKHPFFTSGAVSVLDTFGIQSLYSRINSIMVFPLDTTFERYAGRNGVAVDNTITLDFYQGGDGTPTDTFTLTTADPEDSGALSPIVAVAPTGAGELNTNAIELEVVHNGFNTSLIRSALRYTIPTNENLSWMVAGWVLALGNNAEEFVGINFHDVVTVESTRQSPWARPGTAKTMIVIPVFQSNANDKTYTFALRNNGADVISVTTTNSASGGAGAQLLTENDTEAAIVAGDFLNWRVSMSGGFTAGRAVQFMAVVGFEDDN